jgi:formylglycine-generating enzyme
MPEAIPNPPYPDMNWIPGGVFRMGSDHHYPEEAPTHRVRFDGFWMDRTPVTNAQFRKFVEATGYVTYAEIPPRAEDYPGALLEMLRAGSIVFVKPRRRVDPHLCNWWSFIHGADWRHHWGRKTRLMEWRIIQ